MSTRCVALTVVLGLCCLAHPTHTDEEAKAVELAQALGLEELVFATVIHSPAGFANPDGRVAAYVTHRAMLASLLVRLSGFPARGGVHKSWPAEIPHWTIYVHGKDSKVTWL